MENRIRPAAKHEIAEIVALSVAAYGEYRSEMPAAVLEAYLADLSSLADHWHEAEVWVAQANGRIAGSVHFYADASAQGLGLPQGWSGFRKLVVHPDMRGRGLGRALTQACLGAARRAGARTIGIHTVSFMRAACHIYQQFGFYRCPEFDITTSDLGLGGAGALRVIAYRLDLA
jgi:GNAT superfamily N-acetyltransferase